MCVSVSGLPLHCVRVADPALIWVSRGRGWDEVDRPGAWVGHSETTDLCCFLLLFVIGLFFFSTFLYLKLSVWSNTGLEVFNISFTLISASPDHCDAVVHRYRFFYVFVEGRAKNILSTVLT